MNDFPPKPGHKSTNDKLLGILNGRQNNDGDSYFLAVEAKNERLRKKLHRSILYGQGGRAALPSVKVCFNVNLSSNLSITNVET